MASAVDKQPAAARLAAVAAAGCLPTAANESQSSCTTCGDTTPPSGSPPVATLSVEAQERHERHECTHRDG